MRSRPPRSRFHPADRAPAVIDVDLTAERSSPPQPPACRQVRGDRAAGRQEQQQPWKRPYPHNTQGRQNESDSAGRREPAPRRNRPICVGDSLAAAPAISQTLLEWLQCLSPATELAVDKALLERHERLLSPSPHAGERDSSDGHDERRLTADSVGHLLAPGASSPCCRGGAPRSLLKSRFDRLVTLGGVVVMVAFIAAGSLLAWGGSYLSSEVHNQLAGQKIYFPSKGSAVLASPKIGPYLDLYAGQQLIVGQQAEVSADDLIGVDVTEIDHGLTSAQAGTQARPTEQQGAGREGGGPFPGPDAARPVAQRLRLLADRPDRR